MARYIMVVLVVALTGLAISAGGSFPVKAGTTCDDPTPNGGGEMRFKGILRAGHGATREGDLCPDQLDTWAFSTVDAPLTQYIAVQVLVDGGSVNASVVTPDGVEVELGPGKPYQATHQSFSNPATYQVVIIGAGDTLAAYRVQACRTVIESKCLFSGTVTAKPGDVDCNGRVEPADAFLLLQRIARLISSLPCENVVQVNYDGSVGNAVDAELILQFTAGLIDRLLPGF